MGNDITYIGVEPEVEPNKNSNKELNKVKFKTKKYSISISRFISKTKKNIINKKVIIILLIIIILYFFNPIAFLQTKLQQKKEFYAQTYSSNPSNNSSSNIGLLDSLIYISGYDYYKNCRNTMVMPADGLITFQYDLTHKGIDIACETYQDNIYAAANGYVCYIGHSEKYGNEMMIEHKINGITIYTYYANLSAINVADRQYVYQNQVIAKEGGNPNKRTGIMNTDGHHLHFEVRKSKNSNSGLNPNIFIKN